MAAIALRGIVKRYGTATAVQAVDIDIPDGRLTVLVGPSGCGKSTILKLIAGLEDVDDGELYIGGKAASHLRPAQRDIAMVFQSYALYPHMSVSQNLAFPLRMARHPQSAINARVAEVATILGLTELLDRKPKALSGGQQQRVAIGRAMVRDPVAYLFDEPLSNLDAQLRAHMREEIASLQSRLQTTMVFVTHDQTEAMTLADRIVVLNGGRVEQVGTPMELYRKPANRFVAAFIGAPPMNFLQGHIRDWTGGMATVDLGTGTTLSIKTASARVAGDELTIGIRPEHIALKPADGSEPALAGRIERVEPLGSQTQIRVATPAGPLLMLQFGGCEIDAGDTVNLALPEAHCHFFDIQGDAL